MKMTVSAFGRPSAILLLFPCARVREAFGFEADTETKNERKYYEHRQATEIYIFCRGIPDEFENKIQQTGGQSSCLTLT
jgi:hypothetical protein